MELPDKFLGEFSVNFLQGCAVIFLEKEGRWTSSTTIMAKADDYQPIFINPYPQLLIIRIQCTSHQHIKRSPFLKSLRLNGNSWH